MAARTLDEMAHQSFTEEDSLEDPMEPPTETLRNMIQYSQELQDHGNGLNNQLEMLMDNVRQSHVKAENELEVQFQKVEFLIRSWKCEFDQELKDLYRRQRANVQRQTDHLQDIASSLSKALLRAKVSMAANLEVLTEDLILSHLEDLMEPAQEIMDMKVKRPSTIYFISNEDFHTKMLKPDDRYEIGYIQQLPLKPKDLLLIQVFDAPQDENTVVFKAEVYEETCEYEDLLRNSLSWDLRLCGNMENPPSNVNCIWAKGKIFFQIRVSSQCAHQFSVYLYNQHIRGSPQSFTISNPCTVVDQEHPVQVAEPTRSTENLYMLNESPETRVHISRKDISAINIYLERAKMENSNMEKYRKEVYMQTEPQLDDALKKSEQRETDSNKSLDESIPENEFDISPGSGKRVVRKGRPDTCTPLRRPKAQEGLKYVSETQLKAEPELNLGGTVEFTPTFSSTSKFPILDDLDGSKPQNNGETRSPSRIPHISYDLNQLLHLGTSPLAKQAPLNISKIMGITVKNFKKDDYGKKIEIIESRNPEKIGDTPNISDCVSLGTNSSTVGNLTKLLANVVEVKDLPDDIWVDYNCNNMQYEKVHKEIVAQTEDELKVEEQNCHLNDNIIKYDEEQCSNGLLQEKEITEKRLSMPKSCGDSEFEKECDQQKVNNHSVSFLQRGLFARLKFKMALPKENSLNKPVGVAQLKNGTVVIADTFNDRMVLFSRKGDFIKSFCSPQMKRPSAIAVLIDGRFAVKDIHSILLFTATGEYVEHLKHATHLKYPYGLTMDDDGNLLTIETTKNGHVTIVIMDPMGSCGLSRVRVDLGLSKEKAAQSKPRFIAYQGHNTILIVDLGLNCIYQISYSLVEGVVKNTIGEYGIGEGQFYDPSGIVVDADGFIMVGDSRNHRIQVFDPNGEFMSLLHVDTPLRRPSGLFLTPCGHLFILNYWENTLAKYQLAI